MSRRSAAVVRDVLPDPVYNSKIVTKLINSVMVSGKKSIAQRIVYSAFKTAEEKLGIKPLDIFKKVMENVMPSLEVKARRVGGATYQVPMEIRAVRRQTLGIRWITICSRGRPEKTMEERLSAELVDAYNGTGNAVKKREDTHKMAEANRAFAHFRW
jgi:small subunit ribosomal protein S7